MTLPSIAVLTHHQSMSEGWFLSQDRGWLAALAVSPERYHRIYVDGLCGRYLAGEYDALAAMGVYRRKDCDRYIDDVREQLEECYRLTGKRPDAGVGGYHDAERWGVFATGTQLPNMIFQCRKILLDADTPPMASRPCRSLVNSMVLDAGGAAGFNTIRWHCVETEWRMRLPLGCESRSDVGSFFSQPQRLPYCPQYSQDDIARLTDDSIWDYLQRNGLVDHSILMTDHLESAPFLSRWRDRGFHLVYPIAAWENGGVAG